MISRTGKGGFLAAHYDWLALGVGVLALVGAAVFYVGALGEDQDEAVEGTVKEVERLQPSRVGVKPLDIGMLNQAVRLTRNPLQMDEIDEKGENFLASERRVFCRQCRAVIPGSAKICSAMLAPGKVCGTTQEVAKAVVVLDTDNDGMPDEWERKYGLNPKIADAGEDKDGDDFTNLEEFKAKTDPTDKNDHPDYLDSLSLSLPLKETTLSFVFTKAMKIPAGWRCEFFSAREKDDYGRLGRTITAVIGEEIGKSGFVLKDYKEKSKKAAIKGGEGLKKTIDVSEATIERKRDGKKLTLVISANKKAKPAAVDVQATLVYSRGKVQNFDVVPGSEIVLSGVKYRVVEIQAVGNGGRITVENVLSGKKRTLP